MITVLTVWTNAGVFVWYMCFLIGRGVAKRYAKLKYFLVASDFKILCETWSHELVNSFVRGGPVVMQSKTTGL